MRSFLHQLRRRNVLKSMATYLVAAWLIVQVLDVVGPPLGMPPWVMTFAVISLAVGFPIAVVISWFFEFGAGGFRRETDDDRSPAPQASSGVFSYVIIGMLAAALAVSLISRDGGPMMSTAEAAPNTLAILPLASLGVGAAGTGFVEGLHDDLLTVVSRIGGLKVISRTSVLRFGDGEHSIPEIGRTLGANAILEGSVQVAGDRIRVNVQLIDARTDEHLWAEIFERPFEVGAIFSIQRDIAQAIAAALSVALTGEDEGAIDRQPTTDFEAYSAYLLGRQRMARRTGDALAEAEAFFRRAISLDPVYAEAWAGLAEVIVLQHDYAGLDADTVQARAMPAVQRALDLQPELARAHGVLGDLRRANNDIQGAESSFQRALAINPNDSLSAHWYGVMLYGQGRFADALQWHRRALELDPLSVTISNNVAQDLLALGRIDEAGAQYQRSLEIDAGFVPTYAHLAQLERFGHGRPDEAVRLLYAAHELDPAHSEYPALMAEALLELDAPDAAARWAERATANAADHWWPSRAAILVALRRGDAARLALALDTYAPNLGAATWLPLSLRSDLLLDAGDLDGARELFVNALPEFLADPPQVAGNTFYLAPLLAVVHQARDEHPRARMLLEEALVTLRTLREEGYEDFDLAEVEAHALLGNRDLALDLLEAHLDQDWMSLWWFIFESRTLQALSGDPRFEALAERVRQRMHLLRDGLEPRYLAMAARDDPERER
ncbi:tetratricopeptide repeat protein [Wenzhouxiangella sp. XN79A]|uniref:tetratricopeptide repeat protein n=1 Tax=Wenzhouxiangella sp. XN79A TaxID=2724193 RepID=UPI00144A6586|nr:tetratricopeptide repeat protein [Wenzhouxiangella sp. XN79A]